MNVRITSAQRAELENHDWVHDVVCVRHERGDDVNERLRLPRALRTLVSLAVLLPLFACGAQLVEFPLDAGRIDGPAPVEVVVATATADVVPAPDDTIDVTGLRVLTDAHDVVQSATGEARLHAGAVPGEVYVVVARGGLVTYDALHAAFTAATPHTLGDVVPASEFTLEDADLTTPVQRTLVIAHIANVPSYQAFAITFHAAAR